MKEKIIALKEINHNKNTLHEAIGAKREELLECENQILAQNASMGDILRELGLNVDEVVDLIKEMSRAGYPKVSEAIVYFWEKQGRRQITLREYVEADLLLKTMIAELKKEFIKECLARAAERLKKIQLQISQREQRKPELYIV